MLLLKTDIFCGECEFGDKTKKKTPRFIYTSGVIHIQSIISKSTLCWEIRSTEQRGEIAGRRENEISLKYRVTGHQILNVINNILHMKIRSVVVLVVLVTFFTLE